MMRKRLTHLILVASVNFGVQSAAFAADDALLTPSIFINQRTALIIPVNWAAGNGSPGAPQNKTVLDVVIQFEIALDWYRSVSHGQFAGWQYELGGPFTIEPPQMDVGNVCAATFEGDLRTKADQAATAQGFDPANYSAVVYYFSKVANCPWNGLSDGRLVWINGALDTRTIVQELGHTLQLGHGLALTCQDTNGNKVALSADCSIVPYGDPYNAMGSGEGSFSAIQQDQLGWMAGRIQDVPAAGGSYLLQSLETNGSGLRALRIVDGGAKLWLEYRQPIGVDRSLAGASAGLLVRQQLPDQGVKSFLLDMTPGSGGWFNDAPLPAGAAWVNPLGTMKITVTSSDPTGAWVTIESALPVVPDVRGSTVVGARQVLIAAGFSVGQLSNVVDCNNLGRVASQDPSQGTHAATGSPVRLRLGRKPSPPTVCP
jgi:hypothetical protein